MAHSVAAEEMGNNGLFFIYSDHLGSASAITYGLDGAGDPHPQAGQLVGEVTRYYPFGGYRAAPTAQQSAISDRGYTGHKHNDDLGLIYMNARFFVVSIGRFASADTIVPNPTNPQSYNRYSYVRNNPLGYRDPTGHYECQANGICVDAITVPQTLESTPHLLATPLAGMYKAGYKIYDPDPDRKAPEYHNGQDLKSDVTTNLRAVTTGYVRVADACTVCRGGGRGAGANFGTGNVVIIEYAFNAIPPNIREAIGLEEGNSVYVQYQHMAAINASVQPGMQVQRNQVVGQYGDTGISDGAHLHLEVHIGKAGALGSGSMDRNTSYDTHSQAWHSLSLVDPALIWNIPRNAPPVGLAPAPPPDPFQ